jgi:hypothetical protein
MLLAALLNLPFNLLGALRIPKLAQLLPPALLLLLANLLPLLLFLPSAQLLLLGLLARLPLKLLPPLLLLHLLPLLLLLLPAQLLRWNLLAPDLLLLLAHLLLLQPLLLLLLAQLLLLQLPLLRGLKVFRPAPAGPGRPLGAFSGTAPQSLRALGRFNRTAAYPAGAWSLKAFHRAAPQALGGFRSFARSPSHAALTFNGFRLAASLSLSALRPPHGAPLGIFRPDPLAPRPLSRAAARTLGSRWPEFFHAFFHLRGNLLLSPFGQIHAPHLGRALARERRGPGLGQAGCVKRPQVRGLDNGPGIAQVPHRLVHVPHLRRPGPVAGVF